MKKNEYVSPEMEIVKIETQGFIATSFTVGDGDTPGFNEGEDGNQQEWG